MLRVIRPYSAYQHELDEAIVRGLERHGEELERLEITAQDLIDSTDVLRRQRDELHAVPYMSGQPFQRRQAPVGEVTGYEALPPVFAGGSAYAGFEDVFRGPAVRVTELQRPYLELVASHQPVVDVGCGRGEFLALLTSQGITARGVDSDPGMVERCRTQGFEVEHADALAYLEGTADGTVGSVFCAQFIEHLSADALSAFLELTRRKLRPGGLLIAETVNPHSVPALKTFWVDPTHRHPIFPETALALCALAGFTSAYVFAPGHSAFEKAKFTATAYAVVATAPTSAP